jgi:hypothetical protein
MYRGVVCLGFVVCEVVEGQASVTDHLSHDMVFVFGFVPEKTVLSNAALASMGRFLGACEYCVGTVTALTV